MSVHAAYLTASSKWWPSRKWWAATVVALGGFLTTLATQSWAWSPAFAGALVTLATQRLVAYLVPNDDSKSSN